MPTTISSIVIPDYITVLDVARANGADGFVGLVEETLRAAPEVDFGAARTISGIQYETLIRTALPSVGFRNVNEGSPVAKSTYENRFVNTYVLDPRIEADRAAADRYEDGYEAYLAMEGKGVMDASLQLLGKTFYYGTRTAYTSDSNPDAAGKAKGFPGLLDFVDPGLVTDAGGAASTGGTAGTSGSACSSVWFVRFGPQFIQWVFGQNGQMSLKPTRIGDSMDKTGKRFEAYISGLLAYPGLQLVNKWSVGRIEHLTPTAGHSLTDALLGTELAKFPAAYKPQMILMSRSAREQLRSSRTAVNITGAPAPMPTEFEQIPIVPTDMINDFEGADVN